MRAMMAARAAAATRPPPSPPTSASTSSSSSKVAVPRRAQRPKAPILPAASTTAAATSISLLALFSAPSGGFNEAKAFSFAREEILSSLNKVEGALDQVEKVGSKVLDVSQSVVRFLIDALKPTVDAAVPVLQEAGQEVIKLTVPVVTDASNQAKEALQSAGVDPTPVISAFQTVTDAAEQTAKIIESAKPIVSSTVETIVSAGPAVTVTSTGALFLAYLLFPPVWSAISSNFRGYKGNLSPARTLDLISTRNYLLIDIRSEKDKNKAGIPRLPSNAKNKLISIPLEELPNKIRGLVRDVKKVEAELVAVKISYLKRVDKGSSIVIMDSYSDIAKVVARALTGLGFKNCWIMSDGFSGSRGWLQSQLGTDSYNVSFAEVLSPSRVIPAAVGRFGTTGSSTVPASRKLLPGSVD